MKSPESFHRAGIDTQSDRTPAAAPAALTVAIMQVLWPSFLCAIVGSGFLFSMVDPANVRALYDFAGSNHLGVYTLGFLFFWLLAACASATTWWLCNSQPGGKPTRTPLPADSADKT